MSDTERKRCPLCGKKALQEDGKRYHFDVKAWTTRSYSAYFCRWCKRSIEIPDEG